LTGISVLTTTSGVETGAKTTGTGRGASSLTGTVSSLSYFFSSKISLTIF
jgi:hypothetical protein